MIHAQQQPLSLPAIVEPLTSAVVVFHYRTSVELGAVPHVIDLVSAFLDGVVPERWSFERACAEGTGLRMLKRLAAHEASAVAAAEAQVRDSGITTPAILDPFYRKFLAAKGLEAAVCRADDLDVVRWICSEYHPSVIPVKAMTEAATKGRVRVLEWLLESYPDVTASVYLVEMAVYSGHLDVLHLLLPRLNDPKRSQLQVMMGFAARRGHLEMLKWLSEQECRDDAVEANAGQTQGDFALGLAIQFGHRELAQSLFDRGFRVPLTHVKAIPQCAASGDLEMVKWLHAEKLTEGTVGWIHTAAAHGHVHVAEWVHANIPSDTCSTFTMDLAAASGHFDMVRWLHEHRPEGCTAAAMDQAATAGRLDILQWLHANRTEGCTTNAMDGAAQNGHLDVVQWLHANRTEGCTANAMDGAAQNGYLDVVQWLHANRTEGCTRRAMNEAARSGHFDVVQWLHTHRTEGCTTVAMDRASASGNLKLVQWLHDNRTEGCTTKAMNSAASHGHLGVVAWLHKYRTVGCTTFAMDHTNTLPMLQWLHDHRKGCTISAMVQAVEAANFEKLLFLKENNLDVDAERFSPEAFKMFDLCHFEIFEWLHANYAEEIRFAEIEWDAVVSSEVWAMYLQFAAGRGGVMTIE